MEGRAGLAARSGYLGSLSRLLWNLRLDSQALEALLPFNFLRQLCALVLMGCASGKSINPLGVGLSEPVSPVMRAGVVRTHPVVPSSGLSGNGWGSSSGGCPQASGPNGQSFLQEERCLGAAGFGFAFNCRHFY